MSIEKLNGRIIEIQKAFPGLSLTEKVEMAVADGEKMNISFVFEYELCPLHKSKRSPKGVCWKCYRLGLEKRKYRDRPRTTKKADQAKP